MDMDELVDRVSAWEGVLALRPGPGDGSPEISWGDVFFYVAPDGEVPPGQPFATIITKDYPGEPSAGLERPGAFRVNIAAGLRPAVAHSSMSPAEPHAGMDQSGDTRADSSHSGSVDPVLNPRTPDQLMPHPVYATLGWVAVVDPAERTDEQVVVLLKAAHAAAWGRWQRRHTQPPV